MRKKTAIIVTLVMLINLGVYLHSIGTTKHLYLEAGVTVEAPRLLIIHFAGP